MLSKIKRPLLAMALVMGVGMGVASAFDACNPCPPVQPTSVTCVCPAPVQPSPVGNVCIDPCLVPGTSAFVQPTASTQIGGFAVTQTSASMTMPSSGVLYIIPSIHGTTVSSTLPVSDNEVTRWLATFDTVGNQVVMF